MPALSFTSLLLIGLVAVAAPLLLQILPRLGVPSLVLEIIGGIIVGPAVLGWVHVDAPVQVLSDLGLGMLLFMAGFEIDPDRLRGKVVKCALVGYAWSIALAIAIGYLTGIGEFVLDPPLIAIALMSTSLGLLVPLLKDVGETESNFGQLIIAAGTIAEFVPIVLLSLFFSATADSAAVKVVLLAGFAALVAAGGIALIRLGQLNWLSKVLRRLEDTSAQLRVRLAIALALAFAVAAAEFGLAMILGAFLAGVIVRLVGQHEPEVQPQFQLKLDAIAFGFLVPIFFVTTGAELDVRSLFERPAALVKVPIFLAALLVARGLPALAYRRLIPRRQMISAGLLQATTLTLPIVVVHIGIALGKLRTDTGAALLTAGLLSVIIYPRLGLAVLHRRVRPEPLVRYEQVG